MNRKSIDKTIYVLPILMFVISVLLFAFGSNGFKTPKRFYFTQLYDGWTIERDGNILPDTSPASIDLQNTHRGEVIRLFATLPGKGIMSPTIGFKSDFVIVDVYANGRQVYSFGRDYADSGRMIPKKYHLITLDEGVDPHSIRIDFTVTEDNSFSKINAIYYGSKGEIVREYLQSNRLPIFVGGFLFMYSCLLLSLASYLYLYHNRDLSLFFCSAISLLLALYTYAYNDVFCIISDHDYLFAMVEYISLYLIPLALCVHLYSTHPEIANSRQKILLLINILLPVIFIGLHTTKMVPIYRFVTIFQIIAIIEIIYILPPLLAGLRKEHKEKKESPTYTGVDADSYLLAGYITQIPFVALEIIKYNLTELGHVRKNGFTNINYSNFAPLNRAKY